ncbi:MAG: hypothetical protein ACLR13_03125 [Acutalibacteraceae bacterium]
MFDYTEVGGAPILGAAKPVFKAHGSADARTFKSAILFDQTICGIQCGWFDCRQHFRLSNKRKLINVT